MYSPLVLALISIMIFIVGLLCSKILYELEKLRENLRIERKMFDTIRCVLDNGTPEERQIIYKLYDLVDKYGLS